MGRMCDSFDFFYTAADFDSYPCLLLGDPIPAMSLVRLRRRAKSTDFVRGKIVRLANGRVSFCIKKGSVNGVIGLQNHLRGILSEQLTALKGAEIVQ